MKRKLALAAAGLMLLAALCGCSGNDSGIPEEVRKSGLNKTEMLETVEEYFDIFNEFFEENGQDIHAEVLSDDTGIRVDVTQPYVDDSSQETGEMITRNGVYSWTTAEEAYAYLWEQGQVDLEGNVLFSADDIETKEN